MDNQLISWIAFNLVKGIGPIRMRLLLDKFGEMQSAWEASTQELENAGLSLKLIASIQDIRNSGILERTLKIIEDTKIDIITWNDTDYPRRLREIDQSPPVLYIRGELSEDDFWTVAIVGTRRITAYGRQVTNDIAAGLSRQHITVVSGLARGVDAVAHQASLQVGGRSLAVMGCGVDVIYPPEHARLAENIIASGALLSDYPPGTQPESGNFPPRNRIISGLAQAVIIVEASEQSGALITAAFAAEQGRDVFAVPGQLYAPQSKGTNRLIREGAHIFVDVQDVIEKLNMVQIVEHRQARMVLPSDAQEAKLFQILNREPLHIDEIRSQVNLPIETVSATLTMMELKGMVRQVGGMRYVAVAEPHENYLTSIEDS
jgi:DNA processing protein